MDHPLPVRRHIALTSSAAEAARDLADLPGLLAVEAVGETGLRLRYDLKCLSLEIVEARLAALGYGLSCSRWSRLRRAWALFTEANLLENSRIVHQCCSCAPPERPGLAQRPGAGHLTKT